MNAGTAAFLCAIAVLAGTVAIAAGSNVGVVAPAAAVAVGAGALLLLGIVEQTRWPSVRRGLQFSTDSARVRTSFESGELGRLDLINLLDSLEIAEANTPVASISPEEVARLQALTPEKFRAYLRSRVERLEGRT